jgi:branched-chain amino acid transport system substrate-binding protein
MQRITTLALSLAAALAVIPAAHAEAPSSSGVKIGILNDQSGVYADFGGKWSYEAAKMAVEDFGGKVLNAQIEVITADHQNKPDVASNLARQWYDTDKVDAIMELTTSSVALAVQQLSKEKKKINIVTGAATTDLTGKACTPYGFHWAYDNRALAVGTGGALVEKGGDTWFFITADYAFGHSLEAETGRYVTSKGGKVVGAVRHPLSASDFSSFLLQAQASKAKVIGFANAGLDTSNAIKQAAEFGVTPKQKLAGLLVFLTDVHSLGLPVAQNLLFTESFYWDLNDKTRAWSERFAKRHKTYPTSNHAAAYSAALHYLKAMEVAKSRDGKKVVEQMKAMPTEDDVLGKGTIREDGRKMHPMYLFQAKTPAESKSEWDLYKMVKEIPVDQAWRPLSEGGCPLVAKKT